MGRIYEYVYKNNDDFSTPEVPYIEACGKPIGWKRKKYDRILRAEYTEYSREDVDKAYLELITYDPRFEDLSRIGHSTLDCYDTAFQMVDERIFTIEEMDNCFREFQKLFEEHLATQVSGKKEGQK